MKERIRKTDLALENLRTQLGNPRTMIVGGYSLLLNGFDVEVGDVDIVIYNLEESEIKTLRLLESANPITYERYPELKPEKRYDFIYQNVRFNVWVERMTEEGILKRRHTYHNFCMVSNVMSSIREMVKCNRRKDYQKIISLVNQITGITYEKELQI